MPGAATSVITLSGIQSTAAGQFDRLASVLLQASDNVNLIDISARELIGALQEYFSIALIEKQLCYGCVKPTETYDMVYLDIRVQRLDEMFKKLG